MNRTKNPGFIDRLRKIYHSSPLIVIRSYMALYKAWIKISSYWLPVHLYKGINRDGGKPMTFSYVGWNYQVLAYWLERIFKQYEKVPGKIFIPAWKINRISSGKMINADLAIVELLNPVSMRCVRHAKGWIFPRWLKMYMKVDLSLAKIKKRRDIPKRIRKYSMELEMSTSSKDFKFFYEKMLRPHVEIRHKASAYIEDYKKMLQDFKKKNSTLYFVILDGRRVAGMYEINEGGIPYMYGVGVLEGSEEIMRMGVIGALYYYSLADHSSNNIDRVNIGGTSPLLSDGLTRFKSFLSGKASSFQDQDSIRLYMLPLKNSAGVRDFLTNNPFIFFENKMVKCAMFKDESGSVPEKKFQILHKRALGLGLEEIKVYKLNANQNEFEWTWEN